MFINKILQKSQHKVYTRKRTGSFIGMLDGKIGKQSFKGMKREYFQIKIDNNQLDSCKR